MKTFEITKHRGYNAKKSKSDRFLFFSTYSSAWPYRFAAGKKGKDTIYNCDGCKLPYLGFSAVGFAGSSFPVSRSYTWQLCCRERKLWLYYYCWSCCCLQNKRGFLLHFWLMGWRFSWSTPGGLSQPMTPLLHCSSAMRSRYGNQLYLFKLAFYSWLTGEGGEDNSVHEGSIISQTWASPLMFTMKMQTKKKLLLFAKPGWSQGNHSRCGVRSVPPGVEDGCLRRFEGWGLSWCRFSRECWSWSSWNC